MLHSFENNNQRNNRQVVLSADFVVVGGGFAGVNAAVVAARKGTKVILVQDRPVLGGNASSEVRMWIMGATSHGGNNNRWSREGGLFNEILLDNLYRNKEGNPIIFDTILLEKVVSESNITLLLNTIVFEVQKKDDENISSVKAFNSQNSTEYIINGKLFCDSSGDGILGFQAGAHFRMGAELKDEFGELFTPTEDYGGLLGHTIYFFSKNMGKPVKYVAPGFALKDIPNKIPRYGNISSTEHGNVFWWFEYGGRMDTIHQTEEIKWELWSVVYGVWDYLKNSGKFPETKNMTLEWVGTIPGKRESRRFEGHYMLTQQNIVEQHQFYDAVSYGGWAIDLHPADGVYSAKDGCNQYHSKGIYDIPYRVFVSKNIKNLFVAGRLISVSHVAFGSTRVIATTAHGGQVVGMAAALCLKNGLLPADYIDAVKVKELQQELNLFGQSIQAVPLSKVGNIATEAKIQSSGNLELKQIAFDGPWVPLEYSSAQILPLKANEKYSIEVEFDAVRDTKIEVELQGSTKVQNYTPDCMIESKTIGLKAGIQKVNIEFSNVLPVDQYGFFIFRKNDDVKIRCSEQRMTGIVSVFNKINKAVNNYGKQTPPENSGFEAFEFWTPERRPKGYNIAMNISPALTDFKTENVINGLVRPYIRPNAWVADLNDKQPTITLSWDCEKSINAIQLFLDSDFDHPMENLNWDHPEHVIPFVLKNYRIVDKKGNTVYEMKDNFQAINTIKFTTPLITKELSIVCEHPSALVPASVFQIIVT
jgi:hypothetical protein